jgi:cytochrome c oxidase subunit 2
MPFHTRLRRPGTRRNAGAVALTVALAVFMAACGGNHPDSIFHSRTDFNRDVDHLFKLLIYAGTAVFIFVEAILVLTLVKFRKRPGQPEPEHVHGNTTLEIAWTVIPLLILIVIGIPTVRTIFKTQAKAREDALQVEVIGHQWWWEFRYPQYTARTASGRVDTLITANELYVPLGKTVNFTLKSRDVIHSFWVPALAGKRDVMPNHTNYLWYTPDSATADAWNGSCVEYCGTSHANMRFKAFTVSQADFESWAAHQLLPAEGSATPVAPVAPGAPTAAGAPNQVVGQVAVGAPPGNTSQQQPPGQSPSTPANSQSGTGVPNSPAPAATPVTQAGFIAFPREKLPAYTVPQTPLPSDLAFDDNALAGGNATNGAKLVSTGMCVACHAIRGVPSMMGNIGPNLTHVGSRTTFASGLYPTDAQHLARWVKHSAKLKPGSKMNSFGIGEFDPVTNSIVKIGYTDAQIADIVAYLTSLK